jgi:hypothetical protein
MILLLADAGLPMVAVEYPILLLGFVPIVIVEAVVARRRLGLTSGRSVKAAIVANLVSTVLGFPLLWILLALLQYCLGGTRAYGLQTWWEKLYAVTIQAPWLIPYEGDMRWMVPLAGAYLLIPAFFVSVWVERMIYRRFWREIEREKVNRFCWVAHYASYVVVLLLGALYYAVRVRK